MACITFSIDPRTPPEVYDQPDRDPSYGGRRHVWLELDDAEHSTLVLKPAGYGLPTDAGIIAAVEPLIGALEQIRDAARGRIAATVEDGDHFVRTGTPS
jgi:hypothetical protein